MLKKVGPASASLRQANLVGKPRALPNDGTLERGKAKVGGLQPMSQPGLRGRERPKVLSGVQMSNELTRDLKLHRDLANRLGTPALETTCGRLKAHDDMAKCIRGMLNGVPSLRGD